jgi:poly-gamma-glutamate synthesis protein (capsule biosynthesis protein)
VVVEAKGKRIAFLAYSSILPMGYWAEARRPGCAPMRAWTHYEQIEHDQPGTPARIHTFPNREDLDALVADIEAVRPTVDVVAVSLHWGVHFVPAVLADYQRDVARAAIDAGADLILGHHAHILKGIEVYRGKPVFYSLCNFAMDLRMDEAHANSKGFKEIQSLHPRWVPDFDSLYNFPDDSRMTAVVKARIGADGKVRISILPAFVNRQAQPELVGAADPRFHEILAYLRGVSDSQGLAVRLQPEGDEILVLEGQGNAHD